MKEIIFFFLAASTYANAEFQDSALKEFVTEMSGKYSNEENLKLLKNNGYKTNQDKISLFVYPLKNKPELQGEFTSYLEEWVEDKIKRQLILALTGKGDIIEIKPYDFVHPESYVPGTFNISSLENLTLDDIKFREECKVYIQRTSRGSFIGEWPDCTTTPVKRYYTFASFCQSWVFTVNSSDFPESKSEIPYDLTKFESFPVPDIPDSQIYRSYCAVYGTV